MTDKEECDEREISSFTFYESIDYVIKALDGHYQDAYKDYLKEVLEHIKSISQEPTEAKID